MAASEARPPAASSADAGMSAVCADLLDECRELAALAQTLTPRQWRTETGFFGWTPWDEIAHLCFFDETGLLAASDAAAFDEAAAVLTAQMAAGREISAIAREKYAAMDGPQLLAHWRACFDALAGVLASLDVRARLPWYGPAMSARSFATARIMETWAHGQDIFDAMGVRRPPSHRLKHIAHLGAGTFAWTFVNRGLPVPTPAPYVELRTADGGTWTWGAVSSEHYVRGPAEDFCLLVTQRRNVADTALRYGGEPAASWLSMAQCFAGEPATPPAPGVRAVRYAEAGDAG